ncbi:aminotransferase class V-fold PLP-dependent enzyme [Alkalilimnicola sp. S0819]|uniref:aminotransferase class V-fold PLP-dependent enzyme n=1 Tax=Alkalilimnicola sp. S0819 TaxID=2613922 RepID=UPI0012626E62|nr:aminotransferase class V-fold PLP-dependent enzyme [Alkalilimnicola sp. S0819]KAB7627608.1 aminotransferase class V-fold PLP-dependent enzyme [Alkalilimnicola sp. S0819]MPQ15770.1 aminotransferase class V-fold PLP-dependent enzyme [Alkalilimnicola sp. S0819]
MDIAQEFPQDPQLIYLNHAGVGPWPRRTAAAVQRFAEENVRWGARHYPRWLQTEQVLREQLGRLINVPAEDVALVKNTSEGLSLVAYGLGWQAGDEVIINGDEFPSNRIVWESLAREYGVLVRDVTLDREDPEGSLIAAMSARTRLLAVSSVQYGTGLRMDLGRLGEACREAGALFCVDAIQSLGALRFDAQAIGADFVIADGHKWLLGPEGLGLFYARPELRDQLQLRQFGWHMVAAAGDYDRKDWAPAPDARRFEAGSPNMLGVHGLSASLSLLEEVGYAEVERRVLANSGYLVERIRAESALELLSAADRRAGIVTFRRRETDTATLYRALVKEGIPCAHRAGGVRFSPHFYNTPQQIDAAVDLVLSLSL